MQLQGNYMHHRLAGCASGKRNPAKVALQNARLDREAGILRQIGSAWAVQKNTPAVLHNGRLFRWCVPELASLRFVGYADKILNLPHDLHWCSPDQSEGLRGVVYRLPGRRGYLYGYVQDSVEYSPSAYLCVSTRYIGQHAAAWAADALAEQAAEADRDFYANEHAQMCIADAKHNLSASRKRILQLCSALKAERQLWWCIPDGCQGFFETVFEAATRDLRSMLNERKKLYADIARWREDPWSVDRE